MTDRTNKFDFWKIFKNHDLGIDVHGGNPFSPIWICGMEFGVGITNFYRFMKNANREYDLAGDTQLIDSNAGEFEYPRLATELVACLTDKEILNEYKTAWNEYGKAEENDRQEKLEKFRNISNNLCLKRKYFCANGHGFRMNAFTLSLPNNNDWERTKVYYKEDEWVNVKEFVKVDTKSQYKEKHTDIFKEHVKKRLEKYKPRLVICTGKEYFKKFRYFQVLFLNKDEQNKIKEIKIKTEDREYNFELYCHSYKYSQTKTYILCVNFLKNYAYCIREKDIVNIAENLRNIPELSWMKEISAPKEFEIDYRIIEILSDTFTKIPDNTLFFYSNEIKNYLNNKDNEIKAAFNKIMNTIDPEWKNRFDIELALTNGAKFWILLDASLHESDTSLEKIKDIYYMMHNEIKKQNIIKIENLWKISKGSKND